MNFDLFDDFVFWFLTWLFILVFAVGTVICIVGFWFAENWGEVLGCIGFGSLGAWGTYVMFTCRKV